MAVITSLNCPNTGRFSRLEIAITAGKHTANNYIGSFLVDRIEFVLEQLNRSSIQPLYWLLCL